MSLHHSVTLEEEARYSAIIDGILASSDLNTIGATQVRKNLQAALGHDISDKKVHFSTPAPHARSHHD